MYAAASVLLPFTIAGMPIHIRRHVGRISLLAVCIAVCVAIHLATLATLATSLPFFAAILPRFGNGNPDECP